MMVIQNLAKKGHDPIFRMAAMPIYGKNHLKFLLKNHWADLADILPEAYGAPPYIK